MRYKRSDRKKSHIPLVPFALLIFVGTVELNCMYRAYSLYTQIHEENSKTTYPHRYNVWDTSEGMIGCYRTELGRETCVHRRVREFYAK